MSRTTTSFSNRKIFLKHVDSVPSGDSTGTSSSATINSDKELSFKKSFKKPIQKATGEKSVDQLKQEMSDICKKIHGTLLSESSKAVELKLFTPPSKDKPCTMEESDMIKLKSFKENLKKRLPALKSLAGNLVKIDNQFMELGEELLRSTSRPATKSTLTDVALLQNAVTTCPSLSPVIVEQFFLNFVILTSLLADPRYKKVHPPLKCFSNIHRRILFVQLKVQKNRNEASETAASSCDGKFRRLLSKIKHVEPYLKILQPVEISTVFENVQSYRVGEDPEFNVDKLKSDSLMDPKYFLSEILTASNIPLDSV